MSFIAAMLSPRTVRVNRGRLPLTLKSLLGELLLRRKKLNSVRWGHIIACLLAPWIGLGRLYFVYYLVTSRNAEALRLMLRIEDGQRPNFPRKATSGFP